MLQPYVNSQVDRNGSLRQAKVGLALNIENLHGGQSHWCSWQMVYRPLRLRGEKMAFLIHDALRAATGQGKARYHTLKLIMVLLALFSLSIKKCQLDPLMQALFLGMPMDTVKA